MIVNGQPQYQLVLQEGINKHVLGEGLTPVEQEWLVGVINEHIGEPQPSCHPGCAACMMAVWMCSPCSEVLG